MLVWRDFFFAGTMIFAYIVIWLRNNERDTAIACWVLVGVLAIVVAIGLVCGWVTLACLRAYTPHGQTRHPHSCSCVLWMLLVPFANARPPSSWPRGTAWTSLLLHEMEMMQVWWMDGRVCDLLCCICPTPCTVVDDEETGIVTESEASPSKTKNAIDEEDIKTE